MTLDPHKWLYQPFECGALLVREGHLLREAFEIHPDYLQDAEVRDTEVNLADHGLQLTRMSRAIKVWMSMHYFGLDAFRAAVDRALDLAEHVQRYVESSSELELMAPATLGVVCFRRRPAGRGRRRTPRAAEHGSGASAGESGEGTGLVDPASGRYAVRACVLNHGTTVADVERVLPGWRKRPCRPRRAAIDAATPYPRTADVGAGWPTAPRSAVDDVGALALFEGVDERWVRWVATVGRRRRVAAGDPVVRQWDVDRDFYLILAGEADVHGQQEHLATLHAGDYFGELAALDWGASFGYPRLANVTASTDLELLVLTDAELAELMAAVPLVDERIRAVAGRRANRI